MRFVLVALLLVDAGRQRILQRRPASRPLSHADVVRLQKRSQKVAAERAQAAKFAAAGAVRAPTVEVPSFGITPHGEAPDRALKTQTQDKDGIPFFTVEPTCTTASFDTDAAGPVRFNFVTSDLDEYEADVGIDMQVHITLEYAEFFEASDCADVLDATNGFPALRTCYFSKRDGRITLQTPLKRNHPYSVTVNMKQPSIELPDAHGNKNTFKLSIEFYQLRTIEYTKSPIEITMTRKRADHPDYLPDTSPTGTSGYVSEFTLLAQLDDNLGAQTTMKFGIRTVGTMDKEFSIDIIAHPTNMWNIGKPGEICPGYTDQALITGSNCEFKSYPGSDPDNANGFRIKIGNTPARNYEGDLSVRVTNPMQAVNMRWVAISVKDEDAPVRQQNTRPKTVLLDRPVSIIGTPIGLLSSWEYSAVNAEQWVVMDVFPGNTIQPFRPSKESAQTHAGKIVITPAPGFEVVESMPPQSDKEENSFMGFWSVDKASNSWLLQLSEIAAFGTTSYRVRLHVKNAPRAGTAYAWSMRLLDATEPFAFVIGATRDILGMPVSGAMHAVLAPMNQLMGAPNVVRFELTPESDMQREMNAKVLIVAPEGFEFLKRCPKFRRVVLPVCSCKGDRNKVELNFPKPESLVSGRKLIFEIEVINPTISVTGSDNYWTFLTRRANRLDMDVGTFNGFYLFPSEFKSVRVIPSSRAAGPRLVIVRFTPDVRVPYDDYIRIRAPDGVAWDTDNLQFDTSAAATEAIELSVRAASVEVESSNWVKFQVSMNLEAGFEYGMRCQLFVPEVTSEPNRWWVEQLRLTGRLNEPEEFIASKGGAGFRTQRLVDVEVIPYNIVREGWENPTTMIFETTTGVYTDTTSRGTVLRQAELLVQAPPQFTFICPLTPMLELPPGAVPLPEANCVVYHSNAAERNKLHLEFTNGLEPDTKYAFLIDVVNAPYVNPTTNFFTLTTIVDRDEVEKATVPGFSLAKPMMNTRYVSTDKEDRRVDVVSNQVTFIMGTTEDMEAYSVLEFRAPQNFSFPEKCEVGVATYVDVPSRGAFPYGYNCYGYERVAQVTMHQPLKVGMYGLYVVVQNPTFTPVQTNWGIYVYNSLGEATMAEAWIQGFPVQEILDPHIEPYNPAKAIPGEAAPNPIDIWLTITTPLHGGGIQVMAPEGFSFPQVCRYFSDNLEKDGVMPLPNGATCSGDGQRTLLIGMPNNVQLQAFGTYGFRVLVEDPSVPFKVVDRPDRLWTIQTIDQNGERVDLNYKVVGFAVRDRLRYFSVQTLSGVGLRVTTMKISFNLFYDLLPQHAVHFKAPREFNFGKSGRLCASGLGTDQEKQALRAQFGQSLFSDVSQLPEYIRCTIRSQNEVDLVNTDSERGGRLLFAGPTYEVLITEVNNPQSTPKLNLYRAIADTAAPYGPERWAFEGFSIFPELANTFVASTNPAYGLYTTFTFTFRTITQIPEGGSFQVTGPQPDYYFGPRIASEEEYDPLEAIPPPAGDSPPRPDDKAMIVCDAMAPDGALCAFGFSACVELAQARLDMVQDPTLVIDVKEMEEECDRLKAECDANNLENILSCQSTGHVLEITLTKRVFVPPDTLVRLSVPGYNTLLTGERTMINDGLWHFVTRNADSVKTPLDEKSIKKENAFQLSGVIFVSRIEPAVTKVSEADNEVSVIIRLTTELLAPGKLRIEYPHQFSHDAGGERRVTTGDGFRRVTTDHTGNVVEITSQDDALPRDRSLYLSIFMSNPGISPPPEQNIWFFETISMQDKTRVDCNFDVPGFKIYGTFRNAAVAASILAPDVANIVGIWFVLDSDLKYSADSYLRIWLPPGYEVEFNCGFEEFALGYEPPANSKEAFPAEKNYFELPSGTSCEAFEDPKTLGYYVLLKVDGLLEYGLDYAFQFGVTNAPRQPPAYLNFFRFETLMDGVILHLKRDIQSFELERLHFFNITPSDTTSLLAMSELRFDMQSDKPIPGGSKLTIYAPRGFVFTCAFFRTFGLSATTTCYAKGAKAEFTVDTQDPKPQMFMMGIKAFCTNPEFTPQPNEWAVSILGPLGTHIDTLEGYPGFDITGAVKSRVLASFPFKGQRNPIMIELVPSTIMNQADIGNQIVVTAPSGFTFPVNCSGFMFRFSNMQQIDDRYPNRDQYKFPPEGTLCRGSGMEVLTVTLPTGAGLLAPYNYTIEATVMNPKYWNPNDINGTNKWAIMTRVSSPPQRVVDANRSFEGFFLRDLQSIEDDIAFAPAICTFFGLLVLTV